VQTQSCLYEIKLKRKILAEIDVSMFVPSVQCIHLHLTFHMDGGHNVTNGLENFEIIYYDV
jgi:hypothetical protein